jgi:hypothetical protein
MISRLATIEVKGTIQLKFVESVQDIESIKNYIKRDTDFMYHDDDELDRYFKKNIDFIIFY